MKGRLKYATVYYKDMRSAMNHKNGSPSPQGRPVCIMHLDAEVEDNTHGRVISKSELSDPESDFGWTMPDNQLLQNLLAVRGVAAVGVSSYAVVICRSPLAGADWKSLERRVARMVQDYVYDFKAEDQRPSPVKCSLDTAKPCVVLELPGGGPLEVRTLADIQQYAEQLGCRRQELTASYDDLRMLTDSLKSASYARSPNVAAPIDGRSLGLLQACAEYVRSDLALRRLTDQLTAISSG